MNSLRKALPVPPRPVSGRSWLQIGIILAVIFLSLSAAYWGSMKIHILLIAAVMGLGGMAALLRFPPLGFLLILVAGMFIPFSGPGGLNASILSVVLVLALWLLDMLVVKREFRFAGSKALRPATLFMSVCVLAFALGQIPWFVFANQAPLDAQIGGFAIYFFLLASMIMTANLITEMRWLKVIVWTFVALGTVYILGRVLNFSMVDRIYQHGFYANSVFWLLLVSLTLGQAIFNRHLSMRARVLLYGIVAAAFYVTVAQQGDWKSGWVPAGVAAAVLVGLRFRRLVLLAIPFAAVAAVYLSWDLISTDLYSWSTRLDAWIIVLEISKVSPIIGLGFANYYWYAPLFPIRGYAIQFNAHSQFIDIIAQTGVLGLVCFLWLLIEVGRLALGLVARLPDGFAKAYAHSIFASVCGALMAAFLVDWLLPFAYNIGLEGVRASVLLWIFLGGLVGIEQMAGASPRAEQNASSEGG